MSYNTEAWKSKDPENENDIYCDTDFVDTAGALVLAEVKP